MYLQEMYSSICFETDKAQLELELGKIADIRGDWRKNVLERIGRIYSKTHEEIETFRQALRMLGG